MRVLYTSHRNGCRKSLHQEVITSEHMSVEHLVCEREGLDYPMQVDDFTVINEHGIFIDDGCECVESWVLLSNECAVSARMTGEQARERRLSLGLSVLALSKISGVSRFVIMAFEKGDTSTMRSKNYQKLESALK